MDCFDCVSCALRVMSDEHEEVEGAFDDDEEEEVLSCDVYETATGVCYHSALFEMSFLHAVIVCKDVVVRAIAVCCRRQCQSFK